MRQSKSIGLLIAILFLLACPAYASDEYEEPGGYIIIGGLTSFPNFESPDDGIETSNSMGFEFRLGYRFLSYLSAEVEADVWSGFDLKFPPGTEVPSPASGMEVPPLTIDGGVYTVNVKAYLPFGRFQPYALLGIGGMYARLRTTYPVGTICSPSWWYYPWYGWYCSNYYAKIGSHAAFVMKFGGGIDIYVSEMWGISLDAAYVLPIGSNIDALKMTSFNWGFRFNF